MMIAPAARLVAVVLAGLFAVVATGLGSAVAAESGGSDPRSGVDVSWPQCGQSLPGDVPFAIIGVNGGTAASTNPCLASQLSWADSTATRVAPGQPGVQLYLNTANPGEVLEEYEVSTWPTDNLDSRGSDSSAHLDPARRNPHGRCTTRPDAYRGFSNDLPAQGSTVGTGRWIRSTTGSLRRPVRPE